MKALPGNMIKSRDHGTHGVCASGRGDGCKGVIMQLLKESRGESKLKQRNSTVVGCSSSSRFFLLLKSGTTKVTRAKNHGTEGLMGLPLQNL